MSDRLRRCQCCGHKKPTTAESLVVKHYYKGDRCFGSGAPPFEEASDGIEAAIAHHEKIDAALSADWRAHRESRRNTPFAAAKIAALAFAAGEILRLKRRLKRQRREFGAAAYPPSNQRRHSHDD